MVMVGSWQSQSANLQFSFCVAIAIVVGRGHSFAVCLALYFNRMRGIPPRWTKLSSEIAWVPHQSSCKDDVRFTQPSMTLVLCWLLKIRNRESRFLLPFSERRICKWKNDSFSIHFTILLANDSRKKAKNSQGIGFAIILESESP